MNPTIKIEAGVGIVTQAPSSSGLAQGQSYTCRYMFPSGTLAGIEGVIPMERRFPDPLFVIPHWPNFAFPAVRINEADIQSFMPAEIPDFTPCAQTIQEQGGIVALFAMLSNDEKRMIAADLRRFME